MSNSQITLKIWKFYIASTCCASCGRIFFYNCLVKKVRVLVLNTLHMLQIILIAVL